MCIHNYSLSVHPSIHPSKKGCSCGDNALSCLLFVTSSVLQYTDDDDDVAIVAAAAVVVAVIPTFANMVGRILIAINSTSFFLCSSSSSSTCQPD